MHFKFRTSSRSRNASAGGLGGIIFGLLFSAFSCIFIWFGISTFFKQQEQSQWPSVPCSIEKFEIEAKPELDPAFQPRIQYRYTWKGENYTGKKIWDSKEGEEDYEDLAELIDQFHHRKIKECFVNPENPSEAVIHPSDKNGAWFGIAFALFGGCFALVGIGVTVYSLAHLKRKGTARSSQATDGKSKFILIPFCSIFGLAGFAVLFFVVIPMWQKYLAAQNWEEKQATVLWSTVRSHSDSDGTTYSADIFYRYKHHGREYRSNTIDFLDSSSSGRQGKQATVNQHPKGKKITCFVNPEIPHQAILHRDMGWWAAFSLFPLPFIAVGVGGLFFGLRKKEEKKAKKDTRKKEEEKRERSTEFKPTTSRLLTLLGAIFLAAFWNGIVSIFLFSEAIPSWQSGEPNWFLTLFLIPFVLIGIGFILHIFYRFMACLNPTTKLTLQPSAITVGEPALIKWSTLNGEHRAKSYAIYLVGEETAEYRRGTDTVTDASIFYEQALIRTADPREIRRGRTEVTLPDNIHPSWESDNNSIQWSLRVQADIPFWPDVSDEYDILVLPPESH